jgi:hypothetical protein
MVVDAARSLVLLVDDRGQSRISAEDYAVALLDEMSGRATSAGGSPSPTERTIVFNLRRPAAV